MKKIFNFSLISVIATLLSCNKGPEIKPNIVFVLADDLGYGDVKINAPEYCKTLTPNSDKLAREGMRFTDAHGGASISTPTRYGLLTGRYAWRTRLQKGVAKADDYPLIAEDQLTIAKLLKEQGYNTGIVGKWHLDYTYSDPISKKRIKPVDDGIEGTANFPVGTYIPDGPLTRGFDYFYGYHHSEVMKSVVENDKIIKQIETIEMLRLLTNKSVEYIDSKAEASRNGHPFFLYVPLSSPHSPIVPSENWQGKSGISAYADFVIETDWALGEIMNALDKHNLTDNTLFVFTSDNGTSTMANIELLKSQGHFPLANLRGHKTDIWDGGHRVPFIIRWPGKIKPDTTCDQTICLNDFMATCAELLGIRLPENSSEDGISFLPALFGREVSKKREAIVSHSSVGKFAIRKGKWKLILCPGSGGSSEPTDAQASEMGLPEVQLYNMESDISEKENLYAKYPEIVEELTSLLKKYVEDGRSTPGKKSRNDVVVDIWKE